MYYTAYYLQYIYLRYYKYFVKSKQTNINATSELFRNVIYVLIEETGREEGRENMQESPRLADSFGYFISLPRSDLVSVRNKLKAVNKFNKSSPEPAKLQGLQACGVLVAGITFDNNSTAARISRHMSYICGNALRHL